MSIPKVPKYSISARRFWPLKAKAKGEDRDSLFHRIEHEAHLLVSNTVWHLSIPTSGSLYAPRIRKGRIRTLSCVDIHGRYTYTENGDGFCKPYIAYVVDFDDIVPCVAASGRGTTVDAAELYDSEENLAREFRHNKALVLDNFERECLFTANEVYGMKTSLAKLDRWCAFLKSVGFEPQIKPYLRTRFDLMRRFIETAKEEGDELE